MASGEEHLRRWQEAGLLDAATVDRIRSYEATRQAPDERPTAVEALIYLGVAVAAVGVVVLVIANWEGLPAWAHLAAPALPAVLALAAGQALRSSPAAEMRRGGQVAWVAATALAGLTATAVGLEADWPEGDVAVSSWLVAAAVATALWVAERAHPQVVALGVAFFGLGISLGSLPGEDEFSVPVAGLSAAGFGAAALALAEAGLLKPRITARIVAAAAVVFGALFLQTEETERVWAELLMLAAGGALVGAGIARSTFVYVAAGVGAVFVGLIVLVLRRLEDPTMAALALTLLGVLLAGTVTALSRSRPWQRPASR